MSTSLFTSIRSKKNVPFFLSVTKPLQLFKLSHSSCYQSYLKNSRADCHIFENFPHKETSKRDKGNFAARGGILQHRTRTVKVRFQGTTIRCGLGNLKWGALGGTTVNVVSNTFTARY